MRHIIAMAVLWLTLAVPAQAQPPYRPWYPDRYPPPVEVAPRVGVPNLNGTWYMNGNPNAPCQINQEWSDRRAEFINEHGSSAWGTIGRDWVWIPDWTDGVHQGLMGRIRGDRIIWPNGSYWSR